VEQDLIICQALVEIFTHPELKDRLALRGGTAPYKLHLPPVSRSSFYLLRATELVFNRLAPRSPATPGRGSPFLDKGGAHGKGWRAKERQGRSTNYQPGKMDLSGQYGRGFFMA
jgi:hypothetical protein